MYRWMRCVPLSQMIQHDEILFYFAIYCTPKNQNVLTQPIFIEKNNNFIECLKWMVDDENRKQKRWKEAACSSIFYFIWRDLYMYCTVFYHRLNKTLMHTCFYRCSFILNPLSFILHSAIRIIAVQRFLHSLNR